MTTYGKCMLVVAGLLLAVAGSAAHAADSGAAAGPLPGIQDFDRLDVNHDGVITRDEVPKNDILLRARFAAYDFHHNLRLDRYEYSNAVASLRTPCSVRGTCQSFTTFTAVVEHNPG